MDSSSTTAPFTGSRASKTLTDGTGKAPAWQLELLMQKLRQKAKGTLQDTAKMVRTALVERRCVVDSSENQQCLDQLQQSIKVTSLQTMVEKLEMVTRQQGLKFTSGTTGNEWFISSDMFYLELLIDANGVVQDVKIQHEGKAEQQSCPEIVHSLQQHDFADLAAHLKGLVSIYQLTNADKNTKSKVYIALQALESDLAAMASTYTHLTDGELLVMKSLLGLLQPRKGGHPVKLTFYVMPYEFLDMDSKKILPADVSTILEKQLGMNATVSVQAFSHQKLQMSTTVSISRTPDGKSIPRYVSLNSTNSTWLHACFTVNLRTPIPACRELLQSIQATTGIDFYDSTEFAPVLSLITKHTSNGALDCLNNKGLYVTLPDQNHCYYMTETDSLEGLMISNIPFTLAAQLPQVISTLRQQLAFNTLVESCVRVEGKKEADCIVFEVNALSYKNLTVSFQHPLEDALVTLEFDLRDVTHPQCHLHAVSTAADMIPTLEEHACKVIHRTMSIPVTLRAVIRRWQAMKIKAEVPNPTFNLRVGSSFNPRPAVSQPSDISCGLESERFQNQQQQSAQQVPGMVMNWSNPPPGMTPNSSFTISPVNSMQTTTFPNQTPMELVSPYITLSNFSNINQLNFNSTMVNMLASQISNQQQQGQSTAALMNLLDQVGQQNRKRKRKAGSAETNSGYASPNMPMPRPSPSPSPKSPRLPSAKRSPKRRPSEGSEESNASPRIPTPTTPSSNSSIGHMLPELSLEGDPRWNIDITPVGPGVDTTFSKMLSSLSSDFQNLDDSDVEIESEVQGKFPLKLLKKNRESPKRSMSLDSSKEPHPGSAGVQNLFESSGDAFKPLVTPSLSITPVSGTSSATVNSILASMRPGIEIIPLPNPVNIPNSITVTPILPKPNGGEKPKKTASDEPDGKRSVENPKKVAESRKRKLDESGQASKNMTFGNLQMKPIPRPAGTGGLKRSNSVNPRPVLPKTSSFGMSPNMMAITKAVSGGKPSVSTLKSVSGTPMTNPSQPGPPKAKINREKSKTATSSGPPAKIPKQSPSIGGMKMESSFGHPPIPKLEPIGAFGSSAGVKPDQVAVKSEQMSKNALTQKAITVGAPGMKKAGLLAVIDKLKSQQHSGDDSCKKDFNKLDILKGSGAELSKVKTQTLGGTNTGGIGLAPAQGNPPGSEYMIKPGAVGQGLKLTINKTKGIQSKEKMKTLGMKGSGGVPSLKKGLTPSRIPSPKLVSTPGNVVKKVKPEGSGIAGQIKSPSMKGSPTGGLLPKTKSDGELDLTKKLFMPGAAGIFDGPKFDTKFQIPKKSRSNPINTEKVEDLSMNKKDKDGNEGFFSESPSSTPPLQSMQTETETTAEPPTLTLAASDLETSEKSDEQPPVLSAEVQLEPTAFPTIISSGTVSKSLEPDFISPESPDPVPIGNEEYHNKSTPTIPTTPLPPSTDPSPPSHQSSEPILPPDEEDALVMDIPSEQPTSLSLPKTDDGLEASAPVIGEDFVTNLSMPPPPRPVGEDTVSPHSTPLPSSLQNVAPLVSVHIVHSPQPTSPAILLRSPLVVPSPHSSHTSPYAIDDELMDEALIG